MDYNLSAMEIDAIGEILNISLGASATAVSTMLDARVDITTPVVSVKARDEFEFNNIEPAVGVEIGYVEGLDGNNIMLLKRQDVKVIVEMLMGMEVPDEEFELNEMNISAICEVMNQMMGASATALSELLSKTVNISTPISFEIQSPEQFKEKYFADNDRMVVIGFDLSIMDKLQSEFLNLMPIGLAKELVAGFFPGGASDQEVSQAAPQPAPQVQSAPQQDGGGTMSQEEIERLMQGGMDAAPTPQPQAAPQASSGGGTMSQEEFERLMLGGGRGDVWHATTDGKHATSGTDGGDATDSARNEPGRITSAGRTGGATSAGRAAAGHVRAASGGFHDDEQHDANDGHDAQVLGIAAATDSRCRAEKVESAYGSPAELDFRGWKGFPGGQFGHDARRPNGSFRGNRQNQKVGQGHFGIKQGFLGCARQACW